MAILIYISIMVLISLIRHRWSESSQKISPEFLKNSDPICRWLHEQELFFQRTQELTLREYRFNYDLHSCLVRVEINLDYQSGRCIMNVLLPVTVPEHRYTEVSRFIQSLNKRIRPLRFRMIRKNTIVCLNADRMVVSNSDSSDVIWDEIRCVLSIADNCFPEINRAIHGGNMPELAAIRLFGFPDHELN